MSAITLDDLRAELKKFAEAELRGELSELSKAIQDAVRYDMQDIIGNSSMNGGLSSQGPQLMAQSLHLCHLPGQPSGSVDDVTHVSSGTPFLRTSEKEAWAKRVVLSLEEDEAGASPNKEDGEVMVMSEGVKSMARSMRVTASEPARARLDPKVLDRDSTRPATIRPRLRRMETLISSNPEMKEELDDIGYFEIAEVTNFEMAEAAAQGEDLAKIRRSQNANNVQSVQDTMLRRDFSGQDCIVKMHKMQAKNLGYQEFVKSSLVAQAVCSNQFEYFVLLLICSNALFTGVETELSVSDPEAHQAWYIRFIDVFFLVAFAIELGLRLFVCSGNIH